MRRITITLMLLFVGVLVSPIVEAQIPVIMTATARWSQPQVYTSRLVGSPATLATFPNDNANTVYQPMTLDDEVNYIDFDISITTNVPIWAGQVDCTFNTAVLESYRTDDTGAMTDNPGDDIVLFETNFTLPVITIVKPAGGDFASAVSKTLFKVGFSRLTGLSDPDGRMGVRGLDTVIALGTGRLRVKPQLLAALNHLAFAGTSPLTCVVSVVDRNGTSLGAVTWTPSAPLRVVGGYSITGLARLQGQTSHANIAVQCTGPDGVKYPGPSAFVLTPATGVWTISGLRGRGGMSCIYWSDRSAPASPGPDPDVFAPAAQRFNIDNDNVTLLPVQLLAGNVERTDSKLSYIVSDDMAAVTSLYGNPTSGPFQGGDANGDSRIDRVDLALVAGNYSYNQSNPPAFTSFDHLLVSGQVGNSPILSDHRLHLTTLPLVYPFAEQPLMPVQAGTSRDFWPSLSPNGRQIAFTRVMMVGTARTYVLHVAPVLNGVIGAAVRITPAAGWNYDDTAPSWSPDGGQLAWVCSDRRAVGDADNDILMGKGSLCLADATGTNRRVLANTSTNPYPPAWWAQNDALVFGGASDHPVCASTICFISMSTNAVQAFSIDLGTSTSSGAANNTGVESQPNIQGNALYYLYDSNGATNGAETVRMLSLSNASYAFGLASAGASCDTRSFHLELSASTFGEGFNYYTVQRNGYGIIAQVYDAGVVSQPITRTKTSGVNYCEYGLDGPTSGPQVVDIYFAEFAWLIPGIAYTGAPYTTSSTAWAERVTFEWLP